MNQVQLSRTNPFLIDRKVEMQKLRKSKFVDVK